VFKQGRPLELAAGSKVETPYLSEALRSNIHVGLLCVQENPEDRPNMSYVDFSLKGILLKQAIHQVRANHLRQTYARFQC
jgi:hypothetical protein